MTSHICLYCQHPQPEQAIACGNCGMPLPTGKPRQRRQRRFLWFCIVLALFCLVMMLWLPRSL